MEVSRCLCHGQNGEVLLRPIARLLGHSAVFNTNNTWVYLGTEPYTDEIIFSIPRPKSDPYDSHCDLQQNCGINESKEIGQKGHLFKCYVIFRPPFDTVIPSKELSRKTLLFQAL